MNGSTTYPQLLETFAWLQKRFPQEVPRAALVLGSGFKDLLQHVTVIHKERYQDIPHFPSSHVQGHGNELIWGQLHGQPVLIFTGRFHMYQGLTAFEAAIPAWISSMWKAPLYLATNASGGLNASFKVGDLCLLRDHINLTGHHPLFGQHLPHWDNPFYDMSEAYDPSLRKQWLDIAADNNIELHQGTYFWFTGPNFETPAEVNMMRTVGADMVGMSTVPEVLVARKENMQVLGVSIITNTYPFPGHETQQASHQEVLENAGQALHRFETLLQEWITS